MKILLTGAAGFIGSNICKNLLEHGHSVDAIDSMKFGFEKNISTFHGLFPNWRFWKHGFETCTLYHDTSIETVVHAATDNIIYAIYNRDAVISNNAAKTISFFDRIPRKTHIVYLSTASVYGNAQVIPTPETAKLQPTEIYSQTKLLVEGYLKLRGNYTTLRLSNVYGPNQWPEGQYSGVVSKILHSILKGERPIIYGSGDQTRDFTYVDDVADAVLLSILKGPFNTEINIATGIETSINNLTKIYTLKGKRLIDYKIQKVSPRSIDNIDRRCLDITKAKNILIWEPKISLHSGGIRTVTWLKENHTYEKTN